MTYDPFTPPTPEQVRAARLATGLSQGEAAAVVHRAERKRWNEWETPGANHRPMQLDTWHLFLLRTGLIPLQIIKKGARP